MCRCIISQNPDAIASAYGMKKLLEAEGITGQK